MAGACFFTPLMKLMAQEYKDLDYPYHYRLNDNRLKFIDCVEKNE